MLSCGSSASTRSGSVVYARASSPTAPSRVAEKNIVCLCSRHVAEDAVDLGLEPHVEHAIRLVEHEDGHRVERHHAPIEQVLQATRVSRRARAPRGLAAPDCAAARRRRPRPRRCDSACRARRAPRSPGVRARASARARARRGACASGSMRWTMGTAKASVLPEPVGDLASTSRPARAEGMTRAWIWKGLTMSRALSALTTSALAPSAAKDCSCIRFFDSWFVGSRPDLPSSPFLGESKEARSHGATSCRPSVQGSRSRVRTRVRQPARDGG